MRSFAVRTLVALFAATGIMLAVAWVYWPGKP